jgi:hypothetical protein
MRAGLCLPPELPCFDRHLAFVDGILGQSDLETIATLAQRLDDKERGYVPAHKRGSTIAYSTLRIEAPLVAELYGSPALCGLVSEIVGEKLQPTPVTDESSCSLLFYEKPGDHIGWHYDHNFYRGRHFTVLLPLVNCGRNGGPSSARFEAKLEAVATEIATPANRLIVFEGSRVRHRVTPLGAGERRIIWSMTYCTDPRNSAIQDAARRVKDTAFFGIRALWR